MVWYSNSKVFDSGPNTCSSERVSSMTRIESIPYASIRARASMLCAGRFSVPASSRTK